MLLNLSPIFLEVNVNYSIELAPFQWQIFIVPGNFIHIIICFLILSIISIFLFLFTFSTLFFIIFPIYNLFERLFVDKLNSISYQSYHDIMFVFMLFFFLFLLWYLPIKEQILSAFISR